MMAQVDGSEEPVGLPFYQRRSLYRHVRSSEDNCRKTRTRPAIRQVVRALRMERKVKISKQPTSDKRHLLLNTSALLRNTLALFPNTSALFLLARKGSEFLRALRRSARKVTRLIPVWTARLPP